MVLIISLVCILSSFAGVLLGLSLKGLLVMKLGLEKGQKKMFNIGIIAGAGALLLSIIGLFVR